MNRTTKHFLGVFSIIFCVFMLVASGPTPRVPPPPTIYTEGTITLPQKEDDIFAKAALAKIFAANRNPGIVLRVPLAGDKVTQEQRQSYPMREIEKALAKAGYIVRDQAFFEKVLDREGLDYAKIGEITKTDLTIELIKFNESVAYSTNQYTDENGNQQTANQTFRLTGASIEFKLTSVRENDMVGSFVFNYTPCVEGCKHKFSTNKNLGYTIPKQKNTVELFKVWSERLLQQLNNKN